MTDVPVVVGGTLDFRAFHGTKDTETGLSIKAEELVGPELVQGGSEGELQPPRRFMQVLLWCNRLERTGKVESSKKRHPRGREHVVEASQD